MLEGKTTTTSSVHCYFLPNFNETESAFIVQGHHSYQDGVSQMQSFFAATDRPKNQEYPFFKKAPPSSL